MTHAVSSHNQNKPTLPLAKHSLVCGAKNSRQNFILNPCDQISQGISLST